MDGSGDIGLVGLAVMGANLALNMADRGFSVVVYNRTVSKADEFFRAGTGKVVAAAHSLEEMAGGFPGRERYCSW